MRAAISSQSTSHSTQNGASAENRERPAQSFYQRSEIAFDGEQHMPYINRGLVTANKALAESFFST
jgi:hypothetical protein